MADDPQRAGAVVQSPGQRRRREAAVGKSLVGVDVRRIEQREFAHGGQLRRRGSSRNVDDMPCGPPASANTARAVGCAQREVDVTAIAFALIVFRHERQALAVLVGDFLGAVLVDGVVVAGDQRVVVAEPDLLLAPVALALDGLEVQARTVPCPAGCRAAAAPSATTPRSRSRCCSRWPGSARGSRWPMPGDRCSSNTMNSSSVATLAASPCSAQPVELAAQDAARRGGDRAAVAPAQIGDHQRRGRAARE